MFYSWMFSDYYLAGNRRNIGGGTKKWLIALRLKEAPFSFAHNSVQEVTNG